MTTIYGRDMKTRRLGWLAGTLIGATAGVLFGFAPAAHASTVCAPLASTTAEHSFVSPIHGGQALDAINWGGAGTKAAACTGAVVNDNVKTWHYPGASVAADFTVAQTSVSTYQLVYTPGGFVSTTQPLCVSTVLDQRGAYSRLRPCAHLTVTVNTVTGQATLVPGAGNAFQNFALVGEGDGFIQLEAVQEATPLSLNIKGYGGNGTQVISWTPLAADACSDNTPATPCAENEIFEVLAPA